MEINTVRRGVVGIIFLVSILLNNLYAQNGENIHLDSLKQQFTQLNFEIGTMANWLENNDSIPLSYDFGINGGVEYELFYNNNFSLIGHAGLSFIRAKNEAGSLEHRLLSVHSKIGFKQRIYKDLYFFAGATPMYNFVQQQKISSTGIIDYESVDSTFKAGWSGIDHYPEFNFGIFLGVDLNINNWSSFRIYAVKTHQYTGLNLTFCFAPAYIGRLRL